MVSRHRMPVDVLVLLRRDGDVLLTERAGDIYASGHWALPGGHVERDEHAVEAALREVREEVGVEVEPDDLRFVGVTHHRPPHGDARVGFGFVATRWSGEVRNCEPDKCARVAWWPVNRLPEPIMEYSREVVRLHVAGEPFSLHGWPVTTGPVRSSVHE